MTISKPIEEYFINDDRYLHRINEKDIRQVMNFLPGGGGYATPTSLDVTYLKEIGADYNRIESVIAQKKFLEYSKDELLNGISKIGSISLSPRIEILITASKFRNRLNVGQGIGIGPSIIEKDGWISHKLNFSWSNDFPQKEEEIIQISEAEIVFELGRRKYSPELPSRLTCLFMVGNSLEGRIALSEMFPKKPNSRYSPLLLELALCKVDKIIELDSIWFDRYLKEGANKTFIKSYWTSEDTAEPRKEILFEGMIAVSKPEQREELKLMLNRFTGK